MFRRGEWYCGADRIVRPEATAGTLSELLGGLERPLFVLDLRKAPLAVKAWLDREHTLGPGFFEPRLNVRQAFDLLLYMDRVSPSCQG